MKIFSNFDTRLCNRLYRKAIKEFGSNDVVLVKRAHIYIVFKVYLPRIAWCLVVGLLLWGFFSVENNGFGLFVRWSISAIVAVGTLSLSYVTARKLIDYTMDFMIITPRQVVAYDQGGLLHRSVNTLDILKIKSIAIRQSGLLCSIFDYGSIIFFSEGDIAGQNEEPVGQVQLNYMRRPRKLKQSINHVIIKGQQMLGKIPAGQQQSLQGQTDRLYHYQANE